MGFSLDPTGHGEIVAIRDACKRLGTMDLTGCELYTSCEPCSLCTSAIWLTNIAKVYYGASLEDCRGHGSDFDPLRIATSASAFTSGASRPSACSAREGSALLAEWVALIEKTPAMQEERSRHAPIGER